MEQANNLPAEPAQLAGQASVIRATVQITRAKTGEVETHEIVGTIEPTQEQKGAE